MALNLKTLACVAFFVVMVQGRDGDPNSQRRALLLRALAQLREKSDYSPPSYRDESFNKRQLPDDSSSEAVLVEVKDTTDPVQQVVDSVVQIIGPECGEEFMNAFGGSMEEEVEETAGGTEEEAGEARRYQARENEETSDIETFLSGLMQGASAASECLARLGDDEGTDEGTDFEANGDEQEVVETAEVVDDVPDLNDEESEIVEEPESPEVTTAATEETENTEEVEVTRYVERELLKDLLKKRLSELSKDGYNGKK